MMGYDLVVLGPTIQFDVQPIDSSSQAITVDLTAEPINLDFSHKGPWELASAKIVDADDTVIYDSVAGTNDTGGPGGGISSIEVSRTPPYLFTMSFNSAPWNGSDSPTPIYTVTIRLHFTGYRLDALTSN